MTKAPTELDAERALRAALSQMGSHVGCAKGPVSGSNTKKWVVENTMSLAWRIGRAVALSRCSNMVDTVAESIIAEVGGSESARVLFKGKIVGVERVLRMGHAYGEVIIDSTAGEPHKAKERMVIPFKNENIYAKKKDENGKGEVCWVAYMSVESSLICSDTCHCTGSCLRSGCSERRGIRNSGV
jgi:DUF917 family protein